jgi:uncharacterized protein YycO
MLQLLCLVTSFLITSFALADSCPLKDGDLVFIKSQTEQAKLLKLTTGSEWTHVGMAFKRTSGWDIIEAVQPVRWTSLYTFVRRSNEMAFEVKRAGFEFDSSVVLSYSEEMLGKDYDLVFGWDQERWYCTELVWKAYKKASGEELGSLEKIGDLKNIDHPMIKAEASKRFNQYGIPYNHEAWKQSPVITPVQMMSSEKLIKIGNQRDSEAFIDCLKRNPVEI